MLIMIVTAIIRANACATAVFRELRSSLPRYIEKSAPAPIDSPRNTEVKNVIRAYALPTAARAFLPRA